MFLMPVSGYLFVTAGGFGVTLLGAWDLPNPMGERPLLATAAKWTHSAGSLCSAAGRGRPRGCGSATN
jgi:cytochrome b561